MGLATTGGAEVEGESQVKKKQEGYRNRGEACWSASAAKAKAGWLAFI